VSGRDRLLAVLSPELVAALADLVDERVANGSKGSVPARTAPRRRGSPSRKRPSTCASRRARSNGNSLAAASGRRRSAGVGFYTVTTSKSS
jgi:hypothetical protein